MDYDEDFLRKFWLEDRIDDLAEKLTPVITWLGGTCAMQIDQNNEHYFGVKMPDWENEHEYYPRDRSLLCFSIKQYVKNHVIPNDDSIRAKLWREFFEIVGVMGC